MAETAVILAVKKISVALGKEAVEFIARSWIQGEASSLTELPSRMGRIKSELLVIHGFLSQIGIPNDNHQALQAWMEQVRKLAYDVEDVMDEHIYLINAQGRHSGLDGCLRKLAKGTKNLGAWRSIALHLKDIENNIHHLSLMKDRWVQLPGRDASSSNSASETQVVVYTGNIDHIIKDDEIVQTEKRKELIELLTDGEKDLSIISVWGMGGYGKTTLVNNVYRSEDIEFSCRAWITVTEDYRPDDLSRKMTEQLFSEGPKRLDHRNKDRIKEYLADKKCLIVLDDVWETSAFYHIAEHLGENHHGSRIVITTRDGTVASLAPENRKINLDGLKQDQAWNVFCKRAFEKNRGRCPPELENSARNIVSMCNGWPLALVSIARLLSLRGQNKSEWDKFCDRFNWELINEKELEYVKHVLYGSFSHLPKYLKNCFLYCSMLQDSQRLSRGRLIRLLVAEGFVEARGTSTPEEVAMEYIEELVHRAMLKVVERNCYGIIKFIQVHDIVRGLAISLSRKESFSVVNVVNDVHQETTCDGARRLSTHGCSDEIRLELPHLRTWIVSAAPSPSQSTFSFMFSNSKYLAVLELAGAPIERVPDEVGNLFNLHYLGLRRTKVKRLPQSIGKLRRLQTMDLHSTEIEKLPSGIAKLRLLRHLFAEKIHAPSDRPAINHRSGVPAPAGLWDLKDLQTLKAVEASNDSVGRLQRLTQLRSLRICRVRSAHCHRLSLSLSKLPFLSFLAIIATNENETLRLERWDSAPQHLHSFHLHGKLERTKLEKGLFCVRSLRSLDLRWSGLREDALHFFSQLSDLISLRLLAAYEGQSLCFRKNWFPKLKRLLLYGLPQINQVKVERGAMGSLEYLRLDDMPALVDLPEGTEFLTSLRELELKKLHPRFMKTFKESGNRRKIEHIPSAFYIIEKEGKGTSANLNDPLFPEDEDADDFHAIDG